MTCKACPRHRGKLCAGYAFVQVLHSGDLIAEGKIKVGRAGSGVDALPKPSPDEAQSQVKPVWAASCAKLLLLQLSALKEYTMLSASQHA
jgi:hypothetical protein